MLAWIVATLLVPCGSRVMLEQTVSVGVWVSGSVSEIVELFLTDSDPGVIILLTGRSGPSKSCLVHVAFVLPVDLTLAFKLPFAS